MEFFAPAPVVEALEGALERLLRATPIASAAIDSCIHADRRAQAARERPAHGTGGRPRFWGQVLHEHWLLAYRYDAYDETVDEDTLYEARSGSHRSCFRPSERTCVRGVIASGSFVGAIPRRFVDHDDSFGTDRLAA